MLYLFRERLKDLREEFNLEQKDMGERLNISASAYGFYEQGRNEPSLETLIKIAAIFQVSTDYLLGITNTRKAPVYHAVTDKISLTENELETILHMNDLSLLNELSENPHTNVEKLHRYWQFLKNETDS